MRLKKLLGLFRKKTTDPTPLIIIRKNTEESKITEFDSIEEAIASLEDNPHVSSEKIEQLRSSFKNLKNKTAIKIKNGELLK